MLCALVAGLASSCGNGAASGSGRPAPDHRLEVRRVDPDPQSGEAPQPIHARFALAAPHAGKLLVRVREPLVVTEPPALADAPASLELEGYAQRVLDLATEDPAAPLEIEVRVEHPRSPEETVRVHVTLHRVDASENWLDFYRCRPAAKTTRASWTGWITQDIDMHVESGSTKSLFTYRFGGDTEVDVPLTRDGKQQLVVELGWKSSLDLTR